MITCGSDRSGIASRGMLRNDQTPYSVRQIVRTTISARLRAEKSMMRLIISVLSSRRDRGLGHTDNGAVLTYRDRCLPSPSHQNLNRSLIDSIANFSKIALRTHRGH